MLLVCSYKQTWMAFIHNKLRFFSYSFLLILTMPKINTYLPYIIWILLLGHLWWLQRESHLTNVRFVWNAYSICCVILGWRLLEFVCILVDLLLQRIAFIESQPYDSLYIINVLSTIALLFLGHRQLMVNTLLFDIQMNRLSRRQWNVNSENGNNALDPPSISANKLCA